MNPIDRVIPMLAKVRRRQPGQFSACCPAHEDSDPSLSVRETSEGAVLLHCFSGCGVSQIVSALGLELHDLFPPREVPANAPKRLAKLLTPGQALAVLAAESNLVAVAAANVGNGAILNQDELTRVSKAARRIAWLHEQTRVGVYG